MIDSKRGLLIVAVLTVVLALTVMFPARIAYRWASPPDFAVSGIQGTVWHGSADAVAASGLYLRDVSWRIKPLNFFTAKAAYGITGSPASWSNWRGESRMKEPKAIICLVSSFEPPGLKVMRSPTLNPSIDATSISVAPAVALEVNSV